MQANVGSADRILRIILGIFLLSMVVMGPQSPWGFLGLIPLFTGLLGRCALYSMLGLDTLRKPS